MMIISNRPDTTKKLRIVHPPICARWSAGVIVRSKMALSVACVWRSSGFLGIGPSFGACVSDR